MAQDKARGGLVFYGGQIDAMTCPDESCHPSIRQPITFVLLAPTNSSNHSRIEILKVGVRR